MNELQTLKWQRLPAATLGQDMELQAHWDRLNASGLDLPFQSAASVAAALANFGSGAEQLFVGRNAGEPIAMLVMAPQGRLRWATFQPSQLPLGCWVAAAGVEAAGLARNLMQRGMPWSCLSVSLTQVDPMQSPRQDDGADNRSDDYIATAWLNIEGNFEDYWVARGKNLRQNMRKQRNKLATDGIQATLRLWRDAADMAPALKRYGEIESRGWKAGGGTAIHPDNAQGRFYTRLLQDAALRGEALVSEYLFDARTVAMNFGLVRNRVWVVLKTTYDESIAKTLSPASLLREAELEQLFSSHEVRRIEYYGKVMDWHTKLTMNTRALYHLTVFRWSILKRIAEWKRSQRFVRQANPADLEPTSTEA